jgi:indolepyruvate ferredoxin oxidoreductase alpha subunit
VDIYHYGIPVLVVILDNGTVAMTGNQKTPSTSTSFFGEKLNPVIIERLVRGIGIEFCEVLDPYDFEKAVEIFEKAKNFLKNSSSPAVVVLRHPCVNTTEGLSQNPKYRVRVLEDKCTGCKLCIKEFECPALSFDEEKGKAFINRVWCIDCGCCVHVCPKGAIEREEK